MTQTNTKTRSAELKQTHKTPGQLRTMTVLVQYWLDCTESNPSGSQCWVVSCRAAHLKGKDGNL